VAGKARPRFLAALRASRLRDEYCRLWLGYALRF